jgi:hypothetical protein
MVIAPSGPVKKYADVYPPTSCDVEMTVGLPGVPVGNVRSQIERSKFFPGGAFGLSMVPAGGTLESPWPASPVPPLLPEELPLEEEPPEELPLEGLPPEELLPEEPPLEEPPLDGLPPEEPPPEDEEGEPSPEPLEPQATRASANATTDPQYGDRR